jgi:integrase
VASGKNREDDALESSSKWEQVTAKDRTGKEVPVEGLFRYIPTGIIYVRKRFGRDGIPRLTKSTGESTIGKAKTAADRIIQQHRNHHLGIDDTSTFGRRKSGALTFAQLASRVLEDHSPSVRESTRVRHHRYLRPDSELVQKWGKTPIDAMTVPTVKSWINTLRGKKFDCGIEKGKRGYRPAKTRTTFEGFTKHMNLAFRFAYENGMIKHLLVFPNPDKKVIAARKGRRYTDDELKALWAAMNEDLRDQFVLASECYMRLSEALKLDWDRVDVKTGIVRLEAEHVKTGSKTGKGRTFYLSEFALERVRRRFAARNPRSPWVFPAPHDSMKPRGSNKKAWKATTRRAGIKGTAKWHHLRHTALSRALLEQEINPTKVSEYAGVHMVTIQKVYLHSRPEETKEVNTGAQLPIERHKDLHSTKVGKGRVNKKGSRDEEE